MSVKLYNKKNGQTAICERAEWTGCRDHNTGLGWVLYTPNFEKDPKRLAYLQMIDDALDAPFESSTISIKDYNESVDKSVGISDEDFANKKYGTYTPLVETVKADPFSEDYAERAAALREKNVQEVRQLGLGSNFKVLDPKDGFRADDTIWFGTCSACGEPVSNDKRLGLWEHRSEDALTGEATYSTSCPVGEKAVSKKDSNKDIKTDDLKVGDRLANVAGTVVEVIKHKGSHKRTLVLDWNGERKTIECSRNRSWVVFK